MNLAHRFIGGWWDYLIPSPGGTTEDNPIYISPHTKSHVSLYFYDPSIINWRDLNTNQVIQPSFQD